MPFGMIQRRPLLDVIKAHQAVANRDGSGLANPAVGLAMRDLVEEVVAMWLIMANRGYKCQPFFAEIRCLGGKLCPRGKALPAANRSILSLTKRRLSRVPMVLKYLILGGRPPGRETRAMLCQLLLLLLSRLNARGPGAAALAAHPSTPSCDCCPWRSPRCLPYAH